MWATAACASDPWLNSRIMPKSDQLLLRSGQEAAGDVYQVAWPATVERTEGHWLWVSDKGAYNMPATSGWISKDDVVKVGDAQAYYRDFLQTSDAPWVHWLLGICLETGNESDTAQREYLKALSLTSVQGADPGAARMAVQMNPNMLDAAIGLQRIKAAGAKSADDAVEAADQIQVLSDDAKGRGIRRPHAFFQQAEALNKAFRLQLQEERNKLRGIDDLIARANAEKEGGTAEDQALFKKADGLYQITASLDPSFAQAGPHVWKGCMGRAELYLSRVTFLNDEAWSLIGGAGVPAASSATATKTTTTAPIDLQRLDVFIKNCGDPKQGFAKAHAVCVCLAAEIQALHEAVKCFDQAVAQSTDLVEAYRDRGLAYLGLARCEATLAAILAALEKPDPDFQKLLASLDSSGTLQLQNLDRALVDGRKTFDQALEKLRSATAAEALVTTEKEEIASVAATLAKNYVKAAIEPGGAAAKEHKNGEAAPPKSLLAVRDQLKQLRSDVAEAEKPLNQDEAKAKQDLSEAKAGLNESVTILNKSAYLKSAEQSARAACGKENYATGTSLQVLAEAFASQCNFDRAVFYQKLAVIFASEDERPQLMLTYREYSKMDDLITAKAKPKTPLLPAGQAKASKPSGGNSGGDSAE
jgi:hypothetical protein